ncbi:hypothetical protein B0H10DRAFT_2307406 [Mycena sp. CBHHK59/15]|nr:hypothetical protein B0H10DRAFT_2307406 [Mycena sp. CBHHK59/15]
MVAYVVSFHGDLGTGERIMSLLQRRSIESTPWLRYQFVIYVMETGKIGSDPGFRRMHEVITHEGVALRLDAWRVEVLRRNPAWTSLEAFAASKPSFELLEEISNYLASHYVTGAEDLNIYEVHQKPADERNQQQHENILQIHQYFPLYEEMSWSMNYGDIGQIETCFPPWIYIFKATGKHKYAAHMVKFMTDVHFVYPPPLRHAVRYNIVTNPDGKVGKFRGIHDFLTLTVAAGPITQKKRVIQESALIQVYRQCCRNIQRNFHLTSLTSHHAPPNMEKTYKKMARYLQEHGPNDHRPGRKTAYIIPDVINQGQAKMNATEKTTEDENEEKEDRDVQERQIEPEDMFDT